MKLIRPTFVPIGLLTALAAAGVHTTEQVHEHIKAGTLQALPGIGPVTAERILRYYTERENDPAAKETS